LRGFGVFEEILSNSQRIVFNNLASFIGYSDVVDDFPVRVGFLLSKKKLKKHTIETGYAVC